MKCPGRNCITPREKPWHLACPSCWAWLPAELRERLYSLFRSQRGSPAHLAAVADAVKLLAEREAA